MRTSLTFAKGLEGSVGSKIFSVVWEMRKQGYSEETIRATGKFLKGLSKSCNLEDSESVKGCIARKHCSNGYKMNLVWAYDRYVRVHGLSWSMPFYQRVERDPTIPTTEQIDTLINGFSRNYRPILTLAKYGLRPIEISRVIKRDIDTENRLVHVRTAKGGKGRTVKLTPGDFSLLMIHLRSHDFNLDDKPFPSNRAITGNYCHFRKRLVKKLGDPSLMNIRLYDFRHYYATMLYHKTKDILYVKQQLGHRRLENTLIYTHLVDFPDDEWICKAAKTVDEALELIESGFEYVTEMDGVKLFRKRK